MKRRVISLLLIVCFVFILPLSVHAAFYTGRDVLQHVADQADILTDQENIELENAAKTLSESEDCDVLIAAVDTLNGYSAESFAVSLNSGNWWDSDDAILFLLAMEEREWYIATFGKAISTFTDDGLDFLGETAITHIAEGDYYEGFDAYLDMLPIFFQSYPEGTSIENPGYVAGYQNNVPFSPKKTVGDVLLSSVMIGIIVAAVSLLIMRSSMNTKRKQHSAGEYLKKDTYRLHTHQDIFLYSNLSKTRRQQNNGGSHGGSSIHRSSGGRSYGGRGGRF